MINVLTLIMLNTVYFVCNVYPKHIFEINSPFSILATILNLFFYLLLSLFFIVSINKNKNFFSKDIFSPLEKFSRKIELKRILIVCATQVMFDIIVVFLNLILNKNILYVIDFVTILIWVIIYNICATKENNLFRNNKGYIVVIIFVLLLTTTTYCNSNILEEYSLLVNKYSVDSARVEEIINNLDFLFEIKNFLLDTISGMLLLVAHFIFNKSGTEKPKETHTKQAIRSFLLLVVALVLIGSKSLIFPYSCIKGIDIKNSETQNNSESELFSATTKTTVIKRIDSNFSEKTIFQITQNQLFYNGNLILEYISSDSVSANTYEITGNNIIIKDCFEKVDGEIEAYLYKNEVVCFLHDDKPFVILSDNAHVKDNIHLVTVYKSLIKNNKWEFFEQSSQYLLKHDKEFIEPYLKRFSLGEFNEVELKSLIELCINKKYIQNISKELINTKQ